MLMELSQDGASPWKDAVMPGSEGTKGNLPVFSGCWELVRLHRPKANILGESRPGVTIPPNLVTWVQFPAGVDPPSFPLTSTLTHAYTKWRGQQEQLCEVVASLPWHCPGSIRQPRGTDTQNQVESEKGMMPAVRHGAGVLMC